MKEKWLGLVLIPIINVINYYLTYPEINFDAHTYITYSIDTVQGFAAWYSARYVILKLNHHLPYHQNLGKRLTIQLILTTITIISVIIGLTAAMNLLFSNNPIPVEFFTYNLLIFFIWVLVFNGIYIGIHFFNLYNPEKKLKLYKGKTRVFLPLKEILYFTYRNKLAHVLSGSLQWHYTDLSLNELDDLSGNIFFRANRQYLISKDSVKGYKSDKNGKVLCELISENAQPIIITVSRDKARAFKQWLTSYDSGQ